MPASSETDAGPDQERRAEKEAGRSHHRREKRQSLQSPLQEYSNQAEAAPGDEVAGGKEAGRHVGPALLATFPVHGGKEQNHRGDARQHHRHHVGGHCDRVMAAESPLAGPGPKPSPVGSRAPAHPRLASVPPLVN